MSTTGYGSGPYGAGPYGVEEAPAPFYMVLPAPLPAGYAPETPPAPTVTTLFTLTVEVAFGDGVWATEPTWTDISRYVNSVTTTMGRQHELQQVNPSTAVISLHNGPAYHADTTGGRFSPWNSNSPYYSSGNGLTAGHPVRVTASIGGEPFNVFYGYTQSWIPTYGQALSTTTLNCYDGMALINLPVMDLNLYDPQVIADGVTAFWTCQDAVGSRTFADATGNGYTAAVYGNVVFGGTSGALRAVGDACATVSGSGALVSPIGPSSTQSHVAFDGWFQTTQIGDVLMSWGTFLSGDHDYSVMLVINADGCAELAYGDTTVPVGGFLAANNPTNDGLWHYYYVEVPCTDPTGTWSLWVDDTGAGSAATSPTLPWTTAADGLPFIAGAVWVKTSAGQTVPVPTLSGAMDHIGYYEVPLSGEQLIELVALASVGFVVQDSGSRTSDVLTELADIPSSLINADTGAVQIQGATSNLSQTTVSSYLQQVVNTERGILYQDATGLFQFKNRYHVYTNPNSVNSQVTFTYHAGTGEQFLPTGIVPQNDDLDTWNDINVMRQGGTLQNANDSDSIGSYGRRSLQGYTALLFAEDSDALSLAQGLLYQYKNPASRVRTLQTSSTINNGSALPLILALNLLDRVSVVWKPMDGSTIDFEQQSLIEQVSHTITPARWDTTLAVTPIGTETFALWGSALWGESLWAF